MILFPYLVILFLQDVLVHIFALVVDEEKGKAFRSNGTNRETGVGVTENGAICFVHFSGL